MLGLVYSAWLLLKKTDNLNKGTGWPKSKFFISNGSIFKMAHIWPHIGKAKMCLRGGGFF